MNFQKFRNNPGIKRNITGSRNIMPKLVLVRHISRVMDGNRVRVLMIKLYMLYVIVASLVLQ